MKAVRFRISNLKLSEYFLQSRMSTRLRHTTLSAWPLHCNKVSFVQEAASIKKVLKEQTVPKPCVTQEVIESWRKSTKKKNLNFYHSLPKILTFKGFLLHRKLKIGDLMKTVVHHQLTYPLWTNYSKKVRKRSRRESVGLKDPFSTS